MTARPVAAAQTGDADDASRCYHFASTSANVHKAAATADAAELLSI